MDEDTKAIWKLAASGDVEALSCLRDEMYLVANSTDVNAVAEEFLAHTEMLSRLAYSVGGEAEAVDLICILHIRASRLSESAAWFANKTAAAESDGDHETAKEFSRLATCDRERAEKYRTEVRELYPVIINGSSDDAAAELAKALNHVADLGDEDTAALLQTLMDGTTRERALSISKAIRQAETIQ